MILFVYIPKGTQGRILHRLKISVGHLKKVVSMVENDAYCIDVLHQSQALRKAIEETENLILENHLQSCVASEIRAGNEKKAVAEVMSVFKKRN